MKSLLLTNLSKKLEQWLKAWIATVFYSASTILAFALAFAQCICLKASSFRRLVVLLIGCKKAHDRRDALFPIMPRGNGIL